MTGSESDLLRLLHSTENSFVERKTAGDQKDWVKTIVAFANSLNDNQEGVLFIGATNSGEIERSPSNLDKLQMTLSEKMQSAYPAIYYTTQTIQEDGRECLAVIIPGSIAKPHFAGPPFIRDGSRTVTASSERYESLLASRTSKAYELQRWEGKPITLHISRRQSGMAYVVNQNTVEAQVLGASQFYVTVFFNNRKFSYPLNRIEISFDHIAGRLEVQVDDLPVPL
ncbi:MAG: helix-turn-helix domain-containing protein [Terracidiphilus sp.]